MSGPDPFISYMVKKFGDFVIEKGMMLYDYKWKVDYLNRHLGMMGAYLQASESQDLDLTEIQLVEAIRSMAYRVEDIIETFLFRYSANPYNPMHLKPLNKLNTDIQRIVEDISDISACRATYKNESKSKPKSSSSMQLLQMERQLNLIDDRVYTVGLDEKVQELLQQLYDKEKKFCVVSIVGMGGLGKTTLARKVYFKVKKDNKFDCCGWINVCKHEEVSEKVKEFLKESKFEGWERADGLKKFLEGKKYILFIDDVWDTKTWNQLKPCLPEDENGSRVILTTRSFKVVGFNNPYNKLFELSLLSPDDSLKLFLQKVFPDQNVLDLTRRKCMAIVRKCCGLPLAVVVLGGLLSQYTEPHWPRIVRGIRDVRSENDKVRGIRWEQEEAGQQCLDILALSYNDLTSVLQCCFLYFSSFPEDTEINVDKLIRLWIAEGFITCIDGDTIELAGYWKLMDLVDRCLVQVVKESNNGIVKTCQIHDMLLDLAISISKKHFFFEICTEGNDEPSGNTIRRLSLQNGDFMKYLSSKKFTKSIRTLLSFEALHLNFEQFKLLRVLDITVATITKLPRVIGKLIHLKYLGLVGKNLKFLPATIRKLSSLQTLDIRNTLIKSLPVHLCKITTLRHIYGNQMSVPDNLEKYLRNKGLEKLQTLDGVCVGLWMKHLSNFKYLQVLSLESNNATDRFPYYGLPLNLVEIGLRTVNFCNNFWSNLGNLAHLTVLYIDNCDTFVGNDAMKFSRNSFCKLEVLTLTRLNQVQNLVVDQQAMPKLKYMEVSDCRHLMELPTELSSRGALKFCGNITPAIYNLKMEAFGPCMEMVANISKDGSSIKCATGKDILLDV